MAELLLTPRGYLEAVHRIAEEFIATFFFSEGNHLYNVIVSNFQFLSGVKVIAAGSALN